MEATQMVVSSQSLVFGNGDTPHLAEICRAHVFLDNAGVPRFLFGRTLSLQERIAYLAGKVSALRWAAMVLMGGGS